MRIYLIKYWPPPISYYKYGEDQDICVITTLAHYLSRTETWRSNKTKTQLLLSYINPHDEVESSTVSRWLKDILKKTGIDVNTFKGHSTWSASSSKAGLARISTDEILKRESWSTESTWQRFYNKEIIPKRLYFNRVCFN